MSQTLVNPVVEGTLTVHGGIRVNGAWIDLNNQVGPSGGAPSSSEVDELRAKTAETHSALRLLDADVTALKARDAKVDESLATLTMKVKTLSESATDSKTQASKDAAAMQEKMLVVQRSHTATTKETLATRAQVEKMSSELKALLEVVQALSAKVSKLQKD